MEAANTEAVYKTRISRIDTIGCCVWSVAKTPYVTKVLSFVTDSHRAAPPRFRRFDVQQLGVTRMHQRLMLLSWNEPPQAGHPTGPPTFLGIGQFIVLPLYSSSPFQ